MASRNKTDLPEPDTPVRRSISPRASVKLVSLNAGCSSKLRKTLRNSIAGAAVLVSSVMARSAPHLTRTRLHARWSTPQTSKSEYRDGYSARFVPPSTSALVDWSKNLTESACAKIQLHCEIPRTIFGHQDNWLSKIDQRNRM